MKRICVCAGVVFSPDGGCVVSRLGRFYVVFSCNIASASAVSDQAPTLFRAIRGRRCFVQHDGGSFIIASCRFDARRGGWRCDSCPIA